MPTTAIIPLIVGVLATIMAGFTLISTKENKLSDNRQSWIDDMRNDIAEAVATAFAIERETDAEEKLKYLKAFDECQARIEMREHTSLAKWRDVRGVLEKIRNYLIGEPGTYDTLSNYRDLILDRSRIELKRNWDIVKKGETFFQVFKWTFVGWLVVLGITLLVINGIDLWAGRGTAQPIAKAQSSTASLPGNAASQARLPAPDTKVDGPLDATPSNKVDAAKR